MSTIVDLAHWILARLVYQTNLMPTVVGLLHHPLHHSVYKLSLMSTIVDELHNITSLDMFIKSI